MERQQLNDLASAPVPERGPVMAGGASGGMETSGTLPGESIFNQSQSAISVKVRPRPRKAPGRVDRLPQWKILLHNDDLNEVGYVVETIVELIAVNPLEALIHTLEAHKTGLALLMTTHQERAELLCEQFASKRLTVTIEPDR